MRLMLMSILALGALAGCDAGGGVKALATSSADVRRASELFGRVQQRDITAMGELEERAGRSDLAAAFFAGLANDPGVVGPGRPAEAARLYQLAAEAFPGAKHNLALLLLKGALGKARDSAPAALTLLSEAAEKNRLESMLLLAALYERGWDGVDPNPAAAAEWYERAISFAKDPRAEARLGAAYQDGLGRLKDPALAETYLLAAAKAGVSEAQYRMARTVRDPMQVAQWLMVAALGDAQYEGAAKAELDRLSADDQVRAQRNAQMWRYAHQRRHELPPFTAPVMEP